MSASGPSTTSDNPFSGKTVLAIVLALVFATAAFVTLAAYAPDLRREMGCRTNVYSRCAIGFAGLKSLIAEDAAPVLISRTPLPASDNQGLLIATPEDGGRASVAGLGFTGPVLVVMPKWTVAMDPLNPAWGRKAGLLPPPMMPNKDLLATVTVARRNGVSRPQFTGQPGGPFAGATLRPGPVDQLQTLSAKNWQPVLTDEAGQVVMAHIPGGGQGSADIYVLADPDLLNTQGLANLDTFGAAVTIVRGLRAGDGPVIFDVTLDGYGREPSTLKLLFQPPFVAATLCVAVALALAIWQALVRFGPLQRRERVYALGKEALTDNSAELIRLARREAAMAPRYAAITRQTAAKALGAPPGLSPEALIGFLDRIGRQRGAEDTLDALTQAADKVSGRVALTALAARLYRWRLETVRDAR